MEQDPEQTRDTICVLSNHPRAPLEGGRRTSQRPRPEVQLYALTCPVKEEKSCDWVLGNLLQVLRPSTHLLTF